MRVALIGSPEKPEVPTTLERARRWLAGRCDVVYCERTYDSAPALAQRPDLLLVLGGDGTLLAAIRTLGTTQLPVVGVNLGKLGYLAEFTIEELERDGNFLFETRLPITPRVMLNVHFHPSAGDACETLAVNDCVLFAGQPFRMIELAIEADGEEVAEVRGDGLIIATPSGSTAHNLSAGGPILEPTAEAFVVTPICPHALTFRPLVVHADRRLRVSIKKSNENSQLTIDGFTRRRFAPGDYVEITRFPAKCLLVRNPRRSVWYALRRKLMWAQNPM